MLIEALILFAAAVLLVPVFRRAGLGSVLGYLAAGVLVGPHALGLISLVTEVHRLAELGVVFLLFVIGLELKPARLWTMRRQVFVIGIAQVTLTGAVLSALAWAYGLAPRPAIVVGLGLALSSTAFVLQLLAERNELGTPEGRASFGVLLLQDLAVAPLLVLVSLFAPRVGSVGPEIGLGILEGIAVLAAVIALGRFGVRPVLRHIAAANNSEVFTATALLLVLGTGWLMEYIGLSMALGAFLAGVLLSDSEFRHQITADVDHFRGLLLGLFFMAVGMSIDISLLLTRPLAIIAILAILLVVKIGLLYPVLRLHGLARPHAVRAAFYLSQAGEFGFVLFTQALSGKLISAEQFDLLNLAIATSLLTTPLLFAAARRLAARLPATPLPDGVGAEDAEPAAGAVLIAGFGRFGYRVGTVLRDAGISFVAVDNNTQRVLNARAEGLPVYFGDAARADVLHHLGADKAALAVVTLDQAGAAETTVRALREGCPSVPIFARTRSGEDSLRLQSWGVETTVPEALESSLQLAAAVLARLGVQESRVSEIVGGFREADYRRLRLRGPYAPSARDD